MYHGYTCTPNTNWLVIANQEFAKLAALVGNDQAREIVAALQAQPGILDNRQLALAIGRRVITEENKEQTR